MRKLLILHIILLFSVFAWSQSSGVASGLPYECGFEESEDLSAWTLNSGTPNATDKWMYGTAVHSAGRRSLYPSADGVDPIFGQTPNITVAMLKYKFPLANSIQKYDVSFDWRGVGDSTTSKLYVMLCREQDLTVTGPTNLNSIINSPGSRLSNQMVNACQSLGESGEKFICGSEIWQNVSFSNEVSVSANNSQYNFVFLFIWVNNSTDTVTRTSIAIDNFQINTAAIKKPENVAVYPQCEDSSLLVTWDGKNANTFDIQYRKLGELNWTHTFGDVSDDNEGFERDGSLCSYTLRPVLEGTYEVRVRGKGDGLVTNYAYTTNILVYCPDNHCINYVNLYGPNVTCTYGYYFGHQNQDPYTNIGIIDSGPDAMESRHTLHVDPTETDPRTDNQLHTVPPGALASVRLGNWNDGYEAESITYEILVDSANQGILIVQYAVVLEDPGHPEEPEFRMEVLDQNNNLIDASCGYAKFAYSDAAGSGWHTSHQGYSDIAWKEWTTVGVNLQPYHGQNIKVRFTTMDCNAGGHFGYAYFTVDCANAHIETENCGTDAYVQCTAPDGFAYTWYKNHNPDSVVSNDQTLIVDASRTHYTCRVSFIEQPDCFFEISTTSEPRFPVPDYTFEPVYENCQSKLIFTNTSHVMNKFDGYENHTSERCNDGRWSFRSLRSGQTKVTTAWSPIYTCLNEGDTIEVTYTTYIGANNSCDSTRVDTIIVPSIVPQNTVFYMSTCPESPVNFAGKWFQTDTTYTTYSPNFAGCDSTSTLHLTVYPYVGDTYIHDSICSDGGVTVNGIRYTQPLDNYLIMLKTPHGCDSAIYLTLTVNERLQASVGQESFVCADDEQLYLYLNITAGVFDSLEIHFDTPQLRDTVIYDSSLSSVAIPYDKDITPGTYRVYLRFHQFCCGVYTEEHDIEIRYRSSIVEQKWNDVLTLLSPKYNGGYEFTAFQWYKDGMPIAGATHSYLYEPLDFDATYYVELTREDGTVMTTCPIQPVYHEQQTPFPSIVPAGQHMPMYMEHATTIWYYTISGQLYSTFGLPQGYTTLPTPEQTGAYIIKSVNAQGETQAQVMIVE